MRFNTEIANKAQWEFCKKEKQPHFAPRKGLCPACAKDIYQPVQTQYILAGVWWTEIKGYDVLRASKEHIMSCPHCNHSYID